MKAELKKEHQWLESLIGEWTYENEAIMGPDQPPVKCKGVETVRSLGGIWVLCEGRGEMPDGGSATTIMTLGFDSGKNRYVGTFIASMMTHLWVYEGELDTANNLLTLNTEGPSFSGDGKMAKYQDVIEIKSNDHRVLRANLLDNEGKWNCFMTAHYRRKI